MNNQPTFRRRRIALGASVVFGAVATFSAEASAQGLVNFGNNPAASVSYQAVFDRPTVSPYLNLTSSFGSNSGLNYFTLVQPALRNRAVQQSTGQQIRSLQREVSTSARGRLQQQGRLAPTGVGARFRYYGNYYPSLGR